MRIENNKKKMHKTKVSRGRDFEVTLMTIHKIEEEREGKSALSKM